MRKLFGVITIAALCCGPAYAAKSTKVASGGRSYEECHDLAVARGLNRAKHPDRYLMLKGYGHKTNPQGFMAQCMAGKI